MPTIDIKREHCLPLPEAKEKVQRVADHIAEKFDVRCTWNGDTLDFDRSGVEGRIHVDARQVHVVAELGFLLMVLKGPIEREIESYLDKEFG